MSSLDNAEAAARALGLDPRGYMISEPYEPYDIDDLTQDGGGRWVPWGDPAAEIMSAEDVAETYGDGPADPSYTVLDYLTDQAGALGQHLDEYLASLGEDQ